MPVFSLAYAQAHQDDTVLDLNPLSYEHMGLSYSLEYMNSIFPDIIYWPLADQIEFSDAIYQKYCLNKKFQQECCAQLTSNIDVMNTCSIGNIALMASVNPTEYLAMYTSVITELKCKYRPWYIKLWDYLVSFF